MPNIKNPAIRERNTQLMFGCSEAEALRLNGGLALRALHTPAERYLSQRAKAFVRCVGWEVTFPEWLAVWTNSGQWDNRGVGIGRYCMARHNDIGPYRVGNVSIQLSVQNSRDGIEVARPAMRLAQARGETIGSGKGWTFITKTKKRPYQVLLKKQYIGCFATQEQAEAAYVAAVFIEKHRLSLSSI